MKGLDYLQKQPVLHIDMLEPLKWGEARMVIGADWGALVHHEKAGVWFISAETEQQVVTLADALPKELDMLVLHQPWQRQALCDRYNFSIVKACYQCAYLQDDAPEVFMPEGIEIRPLGMEDIDFVCQHYTLGGDYTHILGRVQAGMLGAFDGEQCAGFVGCHEEGAMGMLEVLPKYRRRGIGKALESGLFHYLWQKGRIPFGQVMEGNEKSLALQKSLGMTSTPDAPVLWLFRDE